MSKRITLNDDEIVLLKTLLNEATLTYENFPVYSVAKVTYDRLITKLSQKQSDI